MIYDYEKLSERIAKKFENEAEFSSAMGISSKSIASRLENKKTWEQNEITKAIELLNIKADQITDYFFTRKESKKKSL